MESACQEYGCTVTIDVTRLQSYSSSHPSGIANGPTRVMQTIPLSLGLLHESFGKTKKSLFLLTLIGKDTMGVNPLTSVLSHHGRGSEPSNVSCIKPA